MSRSVLARLLGVLGRIARKPARVVLAVVSLVAVVHISMAALGRMPVPRITDEFSYLLAADTFLHGRVANPSHPLWKHFEAPHVLPVPTYVSKYPPGQAMVLALGRLLTGDAIAGVWLSVAAASLAFHWMLCAWMSPRWALLGAFLFATHPTMIEWGQNFWGGAVAACGGALLIGAWRRMWDSPSAKTSAVLGVALAVLANSRPFEGLVLTVLLAAATVILSLRRPPARRFLVSIPALSSLAAVLGLTAALMLYYNHRTTGDVLRMPYSAHEAMYAASPPFLFQQPRREPRYRHREIRAAFVDYALTNYLEQRQGGFRRGVIKKLSMMGEFMLMPWVFMSVPLWFLLWKQSSLMRTVFLVGAGCATVYLAEARLWPHYMAPVLALFLLPAMLGLRRMHVWRWRGHRLGAWFVLVALFGSVMVSLVLVTVRIGNVRSNPDRWFVRRAQLAGQLRDGGERHLVIVRYQPTHNSHAEWVYNDADIDASPVVWAREMDTSDNQRLFTYFGDRHVWLVEADAEVPRLQPYKALP